MAVKRRLAMMPMALTRLNQLSETQLSIARHHITATRRTARESEAIWNIPLGEHQCFARNPHHALVWSATCRGRQRPGHIRYVGTDDGKIAIVKFPNVGTATEARRLRTAGVRIGSNSALKSNERIHCVEESTKRAENASTKYSVYAVVHICGFRFFYAVVKIPKYRKVLGENIRAHRRKLKWSQEELAEKADLHHNYIGDVERGEENVSVDTLMRIAAALKVRLSDLVIGI